MMAPRNGFLLPNRGSKDRSIVLRACPAHVSKRRSLPPFSSHRMFLMTTQPEPQHPLHHDPTEVTSEEIATGLLEHLAVESAQRLYEAPDRDRFYALASEVREVLMKRWLDTRDRYRQQRCKRICFLSIEFLLGRAMRNNVLNLGLERTMKYHRNGREGHLTR